MGKPFLALLTSASTTCPKPLSPDKRAFHSVTLTGVNAYESCGRATANTGNVYVGFSQYKCPLKITPGVSVTIEAKAGEFYDLADLWIIPDTANDGVDIIAD